MTDSAAMWERLLAEPDSARILGAATQYIAGGLSEMTGRPVQATPPQIKRIPFTGVFPCGDDPEEAAVGVYLKLHGGLPGWALLSLAMPLALQWADYIMGKEPGTARRLDRLRKSVLGEVGNLSASYFVSSIARAMEWPEMLLPSPPAVLVDMLSVILNLLVTSVAPLRDDLLVVETGISVDSGAVQACLWIVPEMSGVEKG